MDSRLKFQLTEIENSIKFLTEKEGVYLAMEAHKKPMLAQLTLTQDGKSFTEREAKAYASSDWMKFIDGLVIAETEYNFAKRDYELSLKAYDAAHITYKIENQGIQRS